MVKIHKNTLKCIALGCFFVLVNTVLGETNGVELLIMFLASVKYCKFS